MTLSNTMPSWPPRVLSVESSSQACSVALHAGAELLGTLVDTTPRVASTQLAPMVDAVLRRCDCPPTALQAVAISAGPGSYTGLRIGVSLAKGLCYALQIPLIAVKTTAVMAFPLLHESPSPDALLCPCIDAGMDVFCAVIDRRGNTVLPTQPMTLAADAFADWLKADRVLFLGDGAERIRSVVQHPNAAFMPERVPLAAHMGALAIDKWMRNEVEDVAAFEPIYFRAFTPQLKKNVPPPA